MKSDFECGASVDATVKNERMPRKRPANPLFTYQAVV
jgi:hypothetical protein